MAVQFKPKPGKPHIKIRFFTSQDAYFIWPDASIWDAKVVAYCRQFNKNSFSSPGDAARALHYGSEKK